MARRTPPASGTRTSPVPVRVRRTFGDVLKAIGAFLALVMLVFGVPLSLAYYIGWPLPRTMPTLDTLGEEVSTGVFVKVLGVLVWVAWAQFTACVLVEVRAALSGVGLPRRVPGGGLGTQALARTLVGAVLLLSSAAAGLTPGLSAVGNAFHQQSSSGLVVAEAEQSPGRGQEAHAPGVAEAEPAMALPDATGSEAAEASASAPAKYYRIQPPEGRHHDTLWGIAERHLGDGLRYKEIYQLNKDREQPDGSRLSEASLIRPGWILEMPADATGGELVEMPHDVEEVTPEEAQEYREYRQTGDTEWAAPGAGGGGAESGPEAGPAPGPDAVGQGNADHADLTGPGGTGAAPDGGGAGAADTADFTTGLTNDGPGASAGAEQDDESSGLGLHLLMGAPLLAAGLLAALGRSRRNALWQAAAGVLGRSVGDELEPPSGDCADARDALLAGADPEAVTFLDRALRGLSAGLDGEGRTLPPVYAAWLSGSELHLQLAVGYGQPPAPWQMGQSDTYWTLERERFEAAAGEPAGPPGAGPDAGAPDAEAPYPGLVSLGTRDGMRLLLNLEAVPGMVSVLGAARSREAVLSSIAAELATSGWADRMTVTLVGFGRELTVLAPTRVRYLEDIGGLLEVMETETGLRRGALQHAGHDSVLTGRTGPARRQGWAPHLVLIGADPTEEQAEELGALATVSAPLGVGYLVSTSRADLPGLFWEFEVTADGMLKESEMGLEIRAQMLPAKLRSAVVGLFADLTAPEDGGTAAEAGAGPGRTGGPSFLVDLTARGKPEVYAELLGGYTLTGLPEPEPERAGQLREALALLLIHRSGVHPRVLASALWPRGVSDDVRQAFTARLRDWLGNDADGGMPRLHTASDGRLSLSARVVSDWDVLRTLHHHATAGNPLPPPAERKRMLTDALGLAQGTLLDGERTGGRFAWLEHEIVDAQYPLLVAEIALGLSEEHLAAGEGEPAYMAVRTALAAAPTDERLWNELLRASHATGRQEWLAGAADWLVAHHAQLYGGQQPLPARTEALLDELHPAWRSRQPAG
ncbi:BTAD domain-containing putative transcriptional regulator [Streptomyces aidingensis]|uniref:DNA-binding transcriptional activator of the SARP family n=1 Tax=Streptomyces aidingensis TaxID=910347 RepID=A0A1I1F5F5_9ACTN|nr:BTAD domain-containing putative transcriptional regulator [Streptomyces aidingensis]SFB94531.1 DNA-binding transcriptional activator of the SARP family [Streptomyces aidingensis]